MKSIEKQTRGGDRGASIRKTGRFVSRILPLFVILLGLLFPVCSTAAETITIGDGTSTTVTEPQLAPLADTSVLSVDPVAPTAGTPETPTSSPDSSTLPVDDATTADAASQTTAAATGSDSAVAAAMAGPSADNFIFTGAATSSIPIVVPPGRLGMAPALALTYNSYQQNGWVGVGWGLDMGSIQRSTKKGVHYTGDGSDDFVFSANGSATELVPRNEWGAGYYGAKIEGEFTKFYRDTTNDQWVVKSKDGTTYYYGKATTEDPTVDGRQRGTPGTFKWGLVWVKDSNGNYMKISYETDQGALYLKQIDYTGNRAASLGTTNRVVFLRESRTDAPTHHTTLWPVTTASRLKTIEVTTTSDHVTWQLARRYELAYGDYSAATGRSILRFITQYGSDGSTPLPTISFMWQGESAVAYNIVTRPVMGGYEGWDGGIMIPGDYDGDGKTDYLSTSNGKLV